MRTLRRATVLLLVALLLIETAVAESSVDYSERLDAAWDFDRPAESEARFRALVSQQPPQSREAAEALTQVARAQGLQRNFSGADTTLDRVQTSLDALPARVRVRYLLERGRRDNSSQRKAQAIAWFEQALGASSSDTLPGAAYYRVDALHMLAIAAPPEQQLEWHRRAIDAAGAADDARTRGWRGSLLNNLGWTLHDQGHYTEALDCWRQALAAREAANDVPRARIARWTVARGLRSLGKLDEAEVLQRALADELQAANAPDGYVFEELAEIALARGDRKAAQPWAAKAFALLGDDPDLKANDAARLAHLAELAKPATAAR